MSKKKTKLIFLISIIGSIAIIWMTSLALKRDDPMQSSETNDGQKTSYKENDPQANTDKEGFQAKSSSKQARIAIKPELINSLVLDPADLWLSEQISPEFSELLNINSEMTDKVNAELKTFFDTFYFEEEKNSSFEVDDTGRKWLVPKSNNSHFWLKAKDDFDVKIAEILGKEKASAISHRLLSHPEVMGSPYQLKIRKTKDEKGDAIVEIKKFEGDKFIEMKTFTMSSPEYKRYRFLK